MKQIKLFNEDQPNRSTKLLGGEASGILNWDQIRSRTYLDVWTEMTENFWIAKEISMVQDIQHWTNKLSPEEKETYKLGIGQLAVLDSIATGYDLIFSKYISDPAAKACYSFVAAMESIHNHSYTYALSSFTNSEEMFEIFEKPKDIPLMIERNKVVMDLYQEFMDNPTPLTAAKSLVGNLILEGIYFTCGFSFFYFLANAGKMTGTKNIISLIHRDETIHSYLNTLMIRDIVTEYQLDREEFSKIVYDVFKKAVSLEKKWAEVLYEQTPDIDLDEMDGYIEWRANLLLDMLGLDQIFKTKKNPMKWITAFFPENINQTKQDFFEGRVINYKKATNESNSWDSILAGL